MASNDGEIRWYECAHCNGKGYCKAPNAYWVPGQRKYYYNFCPMCGDGPVGSESQPPPPPVCGMCGGKGRVSSDEIRKGLPLPKYRL